ncbi:MAG: RNA methyltransferase [Leptospiraceae bacterium]|nr:RNA methyltransferase [Leptospiraceae bacterium]MCP5497156.1 RNA methyltransferase [Leptospiraceae bacterium]
MSDKSEKSYLNSNLWEERNLQNEIILGLEQGKNVLAPKINLLKSKYELKEVLTDSNRYLLDMEGNSFLDNSVEVGNTKPIYILLGPESGFTGTDKEFFLSLNFSKIKLSEYTLRTEYALAFSLSQIEMIKNHYF